MKGILFVSHGKMAEGVVDSLTMFFGQKPEQIDYLGLTTTDGPEEYQSKIKSKIETLNSGEGVIIFADLFGGTPANIASLSASKEIQIIAGMNLPMILEYFGMRMDTSIKLSSIVDVGKNSIVHINEILAKKSGKEYL